MASLLRSVLKYIVVLPPFARFSMRLFERFRARQAGTDNPGKDTNGVPVPDALLMMTVVGYADWPVFERTGALASETFAGLANRHGQDFANAGRIMDFGCGCGRLIRHLPSRTQAELVGVDYNGKLIDWCAANLPGTYLKNGLRPPVQLPDDHIDILYALSVFTHLREETQIEWLDEFARLLQPGGLALVTFHDDTHQFLERTGISVEQLAAEGIAYYNNRAEGSNLMSTFQTFDHIRQLASGRFEVCELVPSNENPIGQAIAVLRRI